MTEEGLHPSALGPLPGEITAASSIQRAVGLAFPKLLLLLATDVSTRGSGDPLENPSQRHIHAAWCVTSPPHLPKALLQPPWGDGGHGWPGGAAPPSAPWMPWLLPAALGAHGRAGALCQDIRLGMCSFYFSLAAQSRVKPHLETNTVI